MTHRIQNVKVLDDLILEAVFMGGEIVRYDVKQLFTQFPQFKALLAAQQLFAKAAVDAGGYGIYWNDELDLDAESIWENGIIIEQEKVTNQNQLLAYHLLMAREQVGMTQKELSQKTGIYQADISKIERGIGNPSLSTLKRLADGMNMELKIDFVVREEE